MQGINKILDANDELSAKLYELSNSIDDEFTDSMTQTLKNAVHARAIKISLTPYRGEKLQARWTFAAGKNKEEEEVVINLSRTGIRKVEKRRYVALSTTIGDDAAIEDYLASTVNSSSAAAASNTVVVDDNDNANDDVDFMRDSDDGGADDDEEEEVPMSLDQIKRSLGASETLMSNYQEMKKRRRDLDELNELMIDKEKFDQTNSGMGGGDGANLQGANSGASDLQNDDTGGVVGAVTRRERVDIVHRHGLCDPMVFRISVSIVYNLDDSSFRGEDVSLAIDIPW
jgi:hypothetical protein